jgi:isopentenyl-diphosphate Delta-isomerase
LTDDVKAQRDEELFDVVDHRDRVVGRATRAQVHANQLWHRAVHVLVFDRAGRVLLQKRTAAKDTSPGLWDSACSGHVDAGEEYDAAIVRELGEELGLDGAVAAGARRWLYVEACAETGWEFVWVYRLEYGGPFRPHPAEIERVEWWDARRLTRALAVRPLEFTPALRLIWPETLALEVR